MELTDGFWKEYELELQEIKVVYLKWALDCATEPSLRYRQRFLWDHQKDFCIINSRYGRAFSLSPFGIGAQGVPRSEIKGNASGMEAVIDLKNRLSLNTRKIRESIKRFLVRDELELARDAILNFYWLKLGPHELLFDEIQYTRDFYGIFRKGRWGLDESEKWHTLTGIRNRIINVVRFGEDLEDSYVINLNKKLPGLSPNSRSTFLSSALTWNKYAMCAFDCGPALWSRYGFVNFSIIKERMNQLGWPYKSSAEELLRPLYHIMLDYRKPRIRLKNELDEGYSLRSMRKRKHKLHRILDKILNDIKRLRKKIA